MRKVREVLRLRFEVGCSQREIQASTGLSNGSVSDYLKRDVADDADRASSPEDESGAQSSRSARRPLIPVYSTRAGKSLRDLPYRIVRDTLLAVAALAAGDEATWRGTKQLVRLEGTVFSARVGIRHRVLFEVKDGTLNVVDVIHRKELETAIARIG